MPLCVTGFPGSGEAVVAPALGRSGIRIADEGTSGETVVAVNRAVLAELGGAWDMPPADIGRELDPALLPLRERASRLVRAQELREPWVWADPGAAFTVTFWQRLTAPFVPVICVEDPNRAVEALVERGGISRSRALSLWHAYYSRLLGAVFPGQYIVTHAGSWRADPEAELRRILDAARIDVARDDLVGAVPETAGAPQDDRSPTALADLPAEVIETYHELCAAAGPIATAALGDGSVEPGPVEPSALEEVALRREAIETERELERIAARCAALEEELKATKARHAKERTALERSRDRWKARAQGEDPREDEISEADMPGELRRLRADVEALRGRLAQQGSRPAQGGRGKQQPQAPKQAQASAPSRSQPKAEPQKPAPQRKAGAAPAKGTGSQPAAAEPPAAVDEEPGAARRAWRRLPQPIRDAARPAVSSARRRRPEDGTSGTSRGAG